MSFVQHLFGTQRIVSKLVAVLLIVTELAIAVLLLIGQVYLLALFAAVVLLFGFSGLAVIKRRRWGGCSCFGPTTAAASWTQTITRNFLFLVMCALALIGEPQPDLNWLPLSFAAFALVIFWIVPVVLSLRRRSFVLSVLNQERMEHGDRQWQHEPG
jgi:hypothetical protein